MMLILKLKEVKQARDKIIVSLGTVTGMLYFLSILMKVQHWPGARVLWLSTLIIMFFIFIPLFFFTGIRNPETKVNTIMSTILLLAVTCSQFTITALYRPSKEMVEKHQGTVIESNRDK